MLTIVTDVVAANRESIYDAQLKQNRAVTQTPNYKSTLRKLVRLRAEATLCEKVRSILNRIKLGLSSCKGGGGGNVEAKGPSEELLALVGQFGETPEQIELTAENAPDLLCLAHEVKDAHQ